jgi:K+-sensing histidine kinase KdpD
MNNNKIFSIIVALGLSLTSLIFFFDVMFNLPALTVFYVLFVFISLWTENFKLIISSAVVSTVLVMSVWFIGPDMFTADSVSRLLAVVAIWMVALLAAQRSESDLELKRVNDTLELRILARTIASERRAERLEKQIKHLQELRSQNTQQALIQLDDVIKNLKEIRNLEDHNLYTKTEEV